MYNKLIQVAENRIKQKEQSASQKMEELQRKQNEATSLKESLAAQIEIVSKKQSELKQVVLLEVIAGLSKYDARNQLVEALKAEAKTQAMAHIKDIAEEAKLTASKEAKKIVIQTIQRVATEHAVENSVSVFNIESYEMKGRIIGREGRNIRALEAATGIEIIVDDTPEAT